MKKLSLPNFTAKETLQKCIDGIHKDISLKQRLEKVMPKYDSLSECYIMAGRSGSFVDFEPLDRAPKKDPIVIGELKKSEFIHLYEYYFRNKDKPARNIYDSLMLAANEKCPFCGGIGRPRNLDHFLPKAYFPQFSILPFNLVPSCRDCNMDGKGEDYAKSANEQIIHPYLENKRFFNEQWIYARVIPGDACVIEFFVQAPNQWELIDKQRVKKHFKEFELGMRYSIQVSDELTTVIHQRRGFMKSFTPQQFSQYLASVVDSPLFSNHWKKVLYQTLSADDWFCSEEFTT